MLSLLVLEPAYQQSPQAAVSIVRKSEAAVGGADAGGPASGASPAAPGAEGAEAGEAAAASPSGTRPV